MGMHWKHTPRTLLLAEVAGSKPDAPSDSGLLKEEPGCPVVIAGGRRMEASHGSQDPFAVEVSMGDEGS